MSLVSLHHVCSSDCRKKEMEKVRAASDPLRMWQKSFPRHFYSQPIDHILLIWPFLIEKRLGNVVSSQGVICSDEIQSRPSNGRTKEELIQCCPRAGSHKLLRVSCMNFPRCCIPWHGPWNQPRGNIYTTEIGQSSIWALPLPHPPPKGNSTFVSIEDSGCWEAVSSVCHSQAMSSWCLCCLLLSPWPTFCSASSPPFLKSMRVAPLFLLFLGL